jgi:hypothetical protein
VLAPVVALGGPMNRNFLVPAFRRCPGPASCFPPVRESAYTFDTAVLRTPSGRFISGGKVALLVELKGVRDATGALVSTNASDPRDDFKVILAAGQVTVPGVGTLPTNALPDTVIGFDLRDGKARIVYKTPDSLPAGLVTEGGAVSIVDNQDKRFATIGSQSHP